MEHKDYIMSSLDEYFDILDREKKQRSKLVVKSFGKYLQQSKKAANIDTQAKKIQGQ